MSRVVFDSQAFAEQMYGGVTRYFLALAENLARVTDWEPYLALGIHISRDARTVDAGRFGPRLRVPLTPHSHRIRQFVNRQLMRSFHPKADGRTVYHPTWYDRSAISAWERLPVVVTIHDLIPESWPSVTSPQQLEDRRQALLRAQAVICVSDSTRVRLVDHYPFVSERTTVIHHGLHPLPPASRPSGHSGDFLVYLGKRGSYKDFPTLVRAMVELSDPVDVIAVGGGPPTTHERDLLRRLGLESRVRFEQGATDQRLADLLADSRGLVSTSREEGFGLPPLEALAAGRPVVLSDIPVHRELYATWARLFVAGDEASLANAIAETLANPMVLPARATLEAQFSWRRAAELTAEVYNRAVS